MKILICEDDTLTLKALEHKLKKDGYTIISAQDGKTACDMLSELNDIDLLLTDLHMPVLSGLELINFVRGNLKSNMPIIMLSRVGLEETVLQAFELGADDYITKPFNPDELTLRIKRLLIKAKNN
ncbi:MAG TPA: response regulator transcription factor [Bacteroidales bacterium]|jgi:DNA-binding response OmpR family regulator|nr:response regulator transcription factor [Bacteroidales bacterium]